MIELCQFTLIIEKPIFPFIKIILIPKVIYQLHLLAASYVANKRNVISSDKPYVAVREFNLCVLQFNTCTLLNDLGDIIEQDIAELIELHKSNCISGDIV